MFKVSNNSFSNSFSKNIYKYSDSENIYNNEMKTKKSSFADCIFNNNTTTKNVSNLSFIDSMIGWSLKL